MMINIATGEKVLVEKIGKDAKKADRFKKLGFKFLGDKIGQIEKSRESMRVAYKSYRYVTQEQIDDFNRKLRKETSYNGGRSWKELSFCNIENYDMVPPDEALDKLEVAQEKKVFDYFEVAYIRNVEDPIIFGRINGCTDRFFIAQWDDDVSIDQIFLGDVGKNVNK